MRKGQKVRILRTNQIATMLSEKMIQRYVQAEFIEASVLPGSDRAERGFGSSGV